MPECLLFCKQQRNVKQCLCQYIQGKKLLGFQVKYLQCENFQIIGLGHMQAGQWIRVSIFAAAQWQAAHLSASTPGQPGRCRGSAAEVKGTIPSNKTPSFEGHLHDFQLIKAVDSILINTIMMYLTCPQREDRRLLEHPSPEKDKPYWKA